MILGFQASKSHRAVWIGRLPQKLRDMSFGANIQPRHASHFPPKSAHTRQLQIIRAAERASRPSGAPLTRGIAGRPVKADVSRRLVLMKRLKIRAFGRFRVQQVLKIVVHSFVSCRLINCNSNSNKKCAATQVDRHHNTSIITAVLTSKVHTPEGAASEAS